MTGPFHRQVREASGPVLELKALQRSYGAVRAVDSVDLAVGEGEFVTFLGPSGSGKTTTLMMVAGLLQPTGGEMLLRGMPLGPIPPYRRNIGVVFQNYALFPHLTAGRNVAFPLEMRRVPRPEIRRRMLDALRLVGLPDHADRLPSQLSGGQQQRVALARAIVFKPSLLLMDEPLGALDKKLRDQMQVEISRLHRELGVSVLYVTHDQEEALVLSDRIAVFNAGRIEQIGSPATLYERPKTRFVADFVGCSSFLPGRVRETRGELATVDTSDGPILGFNSGDLAPGTDAAVAIRPERLILGAAALGLPNKVRATVREVVYLGQSRRVLLESKGGTELVASQPVSEFDLLGIQPGLQVLAAWTSQHCNVLAV